MAKILCIDDDRDIRETLKITLESNGHTVETANSGKEGFEKAKKFKPQMIVLDVMMDDQTDGFHTAYNLRGDESLTNVPILMLTSVNQVTGLKFNKEKDGSFLPVDEFIEKPIEPKKLIALTNKLLALKPDQINNKK